MQSLRTSILTAVLLSLLVAPFAFADDDRDNRGKGKDKDDDKKSFTFKMPFTTIGTSTESLMSQIKSLQEALQNLKKERESLHGSENKEEKKELKMEIKQTERELTFLRSLKRGMSGDDVKDLQELLAQDPEIFAAMHITGYFGPMTEAALKKFQKKHGIDAIGVFGPKTQAKILALFAGRELPPGIIARLGLATSSTTPGSGIVTVCHKPAGSAQQTLVIAVPALGAHLAHGDTVGVCAGSATTTPDTTAPSLTNITSSVSTSSATISWNTNENANGTVLYGLTTSYGSSTTQSAMTTSRSLTLTGLTPSTLYNFVVKSSDSAGNTATSSNMTFTTSALPVADTTAPTISNIATSTATNAATITWTTNEAANSRIYYSSSTPVSIGSALLAQDATLLTNHSLPIAGLTASTTYYFLITSTDAANNTATSSELMFRTN